jgi:hypothetical protein
MKRLYGRSLKVHGRSQVLTGMKKMLKLRE